MGIIKLEIARNELPNKEILKKLREFCNKKKLFSFLMNAQVALEEIWVEYI